MQSQHKRSEWQQKVLDKNSLQTNNIILKDKYRLVTDNSIIANIFDKYFINISNTLKPSMPKSKSLSDSIKLYEDYFSVLKIKENIMK